VCQRLTLTPNELHQARAHLIRQGRVAYQSPLYQVLTLDDDLASAIDDAASPDDLDPVEVQAAFERLWEVLS
jgi:hypothetical protein